MSYTYAFIRLPRALIISYATIMSHSDNTYIFFYIRDHMNVAL